MKTSNSRNRNGAGKGDSPRPVDKKKYDREYERIFGRKRGYKVTLIDRRPFGDITMRFLEAE